MQIGTNAQGRHCDSIEKRLEFVSRWSLEDDQEFNQIVASKCLWEPCSYKDVHISIPIELFALSPETLSSAIFSMETWASLSAVDRDHLKSYLPPGSDEEVNSNLQMLFCGENYRFGNPVASFCRNLINGEYNSQVRLLKDQIDQIERRSHALCMKSYYSKTLHTILEYKRNLGLRVEDNVIEFFRELPDANDRELKRGLERSKRALMRRARRYRKERQLSSILKVATAIAASNPGYIPNRVCVGGGGGRGIDIDAFALDMAEMGVLMPKRYQYDLNKWEEDVYYSDRERDDEDGVVYVSDETVSMDSEEEEGGDGRRKKWSAMAQEGNMGDSKLHRYRDDGHDDDGMEGSADLGRLLAKKDAMVSKRKIKRRQLSRAIIKRDSVFFALIQSAFCNGSASVSFAVIVDAVRASSKVELLVPCGFEVERMVALALKMLEKPQRDLFRLILKDREGAIPIVPYVVAHRDGCGGDTGDSGSANVDCVDGTFWSWNMDCAHPMFDKLEHLENVFYFCLTRGHFTADGGELDVSYFLSKSNKNSLTIGPEVDDSVLEFRELEARRYQNPDVPFAMEFRRTGRGFFGKYYVSALKNPGNVARAQATLRLDRPPYVSLLNLVKDAVYRLPGGVGTRPDIVFLFKDSQYLRGDLEIAQLNNIVSGALDRLHSEFDSCVRFDSELKVWVNLHRFRSVEDFERAKGLEEKGGLLDDFSPVIDGIDPLVDIGRRMNAIRTFLRR